MPDPAQISHSLNTILTELSYLRDSGVLNPQQFSSITAQLPQSNAQPSSYTDPSYNPGFAQQFHPGQVAQQAQNPENPANPQHPKHHEWLGKFAGQMGNAALWGAGATAGSDLVNAAFRHM